MVAVAPGSGCQTIIEGNRGGACMMSDGDYHIFEGPSIARVALTPNKEHVERDTTH